MTSSGGQDWRGGRVPRNSERSEEAAPSWKQSPHSPAARGRTKGLRPKLRIAVAILFLIALVVAVIATWDPAQKHRTHFVVLNLMDGAGPFDTAAALTLPEGIETATSTRIVTLCHLPILALNSKSPADQSNLDAAHTVVINLQTTFVPGPNGEFRCLISNSTPNLDKADQFAELATLKSELDALWKIDPSKHVLLLVDSPPTSWEWRTGCLHSSLVDEFEKWTTASKNLVVLLSSPSNGLSEPGTTGTNGKSIFGHFASIGFSNLADQNLDQKLTVAEFCKYVTDHTDGWVRDHRNVDGQAVTVLPLDSLSKGDRDFTVFTDLVQLPDTAEQIGGKSSADFTAADLTAIKNQWMLRQSLQLRGGPRWNPLLWKSATDDLVRAEKAFLSGQGKKARLALTQSTGTLRELETLTNEICPQPESIDPDRGLPFSDFREFPSLDRVKPLFPAAAGEAGVATGEGGAATGFTSAEDVLVANIQGFPFSSVGLTQPADVDFIRARRATAEAAVARMLGCADQLASTVKRLESTLLLSEDRHFTRPVAGESAATEDSNPDLLITAVGEFTDAQNRAETTLFELLDNASSLAFWAANPAWEVSDSDRKFWLKVLVRNEPTVTVTGDIPSTMFDPLKGISDEGVSGTPDHELSAQKLQKEIYRLLVYGRALQRNLLFIEPVQGFTANELQTVTEALKSAQKDASSSQQEIQDLLEKMCKEALGEKPAKRAGQVRAYKFLRSTLSLTSIRPETRMSVLSSLQEWDAAFATTKVPAPEADVQHDASLVQPGIAAEALWMLQVLNFLPEHEQQSVLLGQAWNAAKSLAEDDSADEHDAAFRLGEPVRKVWKQNRELVVVAVRDTTADAHSLLRTADQRARLFSGFDAGPKSLRSPTERLRQLNRIQYCLMHADRLLFGLWIEPGDSPPLEQKGWYAKATDVWLTAARKCEQRLSTDGMGTPAPIVESLRKLESRLSDSKNLVLTFGTDQRDLDLREQSNRSGTIKGTIQMTGCAGISGEAAVLVRLEPNAPFVVENNGQALRVGDGAMDSVLAFRRLRDPGTVDCLSVPISPETFFRGRFRKAEPAVIVDPCAPAEFVVDKKARSQTASVKVSGADPRPIVVILDFSGSMNEPLSTKPETLRYQEALTTLESLVRNGALNGSRVILNVYGHRVKYDPVAKIVVPNPLYAKCFGKPIPGGLVEMDDIENEFDGKIGTPEALADFNRVIDSLRCSKPFGFTPLAKAITDALSADLQKKAGIVIAISDGEAKDLTSRREIDLRDAQKQNGVSSVTIVAFDVAANPVARQELEKTFRPFNIGIIDAAQQAQLEAKILGLLDPRVYTITWDDGAKSKIAPLGTAITDLAPATERKFSIQFSEINTLQPIVLQPADIVDLDIDHSRKLLLFKREKSAVSRKASGGQFAADSPTSLKSLAPPRSSDPLAGQNPQMGKAELRLMLDHERDDLPVRQPAEIEFAVRPVSSESTFRPALIQQVFTSEAGAPGWNLTIGEWPKQQLFLVDAVWKMDRTLAEQVIPWKDLKAADSIDKAVPVREVGLPEFGVWVTLLDNELQVRLDPVTVVRKSEAPRALKALGEELALNRVEDVRIEIGMKDTASLNAAFLPWEVETRVIRLETGSVRYVFSGDQITRATVADAAIAFTSAAARKAGAIEVSDFRIE